MSLKVEDIKKLMGWCPHVKASQTGSWISSVNFEANNRSGEENARSPTVPSQHSRLDTHLLLLPIFFTPIFINFLFQKGINVEAFFLGLSLSLPIYLLGWKKQMHQIRCREKKTCCFSFL